MFKTKQAMFCQTWLLSNPFAIEAIIIPLVDVESYIFVTMDFGRRRSHKTHLVVTNFVQFQTTNICYTAPSHHELHFLYSLYVCTCTFCHDLLLLLYYLLYYITFVRKFQWLCKLEGGHVPTCPLPGTTPLSGKLN